MRNRTLSLPRYHLGTLFITSYILHSTEYLNLTVQEGTIINQKNCIFQGLEHLCILVHYDLMSYQLWTFATFFFTWSGRSFIKSFYVILKLTS